ncbi:MAG: hypothetical protein QOG21_225 [Actinomycetota bacterium]|nr:hypothetical protein [Actinomycetota bacterium]
MVPAPAHRATGQPARAQLGRTPGAQSPHLEQRPAVGYVSVHSQDGSRDGLYVDDVVTFASVLIGVLERAPARGESKTAIATGEIPEVSHPAMMARRFRVA